MAIEIFNRYEHKYKLDTKTFNKVLEIMGINSEEEMELEPFYAAIKTYPDMIRFIP